MTNIDLLGSDLEKKVKATSAECEAEWHKIKGKAGLFKWRIINFKVVPDTVIDTFYAGDSYIVLKAEALPKGMIYHIHFWQGKKSTLDELGVSAYKAAELDTFLGCGPTQHREVQEFESRLFLSYFTNFIVLEGGVDSGFKKVEATKYRTRLLHIKGTAKTMCMREVPLTKDSVNSGDVFLLDLGTKLIQFQGKDSSPFERNKAGTCCRAIDDQRGSNIDIVTFSESDAKYPEEWMKAIGKGPFKTASDGGTDIAATARKELFQVTDSSGNIEFKKLGEGNAIKRSMIGSDDAYILYSGGELFTFVGKKASKRERESVFGIAVKFMKDSNIPPNTAVHRMIEGGENEIFENALK